MSRYFIANEYRATCIEIWANIFGALSDELAETAATFSAARRREIFHANFPEAKDGPDRPSNISLARYNAVKEAVTG